MKKVMTITAMILTTITSIFALTNSHTIILSSTVEAIQPEFALVNTLTGETNKKSVSYFSEDIAKHNVTGSFEIRQTNNARYNGTILFTVKATALKTSVNGKTYSTEEAVIIMDNVKTTSTASFELSMNGCYTKSNTVKSFDVLWNTNDSLVDGIYEASVVLSYSAR